MVKESGELVNINATESTDVSSIARSEFDEDSTDISEETDEIRAQIEDTRVEMSETIDAIQKRLSYANISEQVSDQVNNAIETAKGSIYDATVGQVVNYMRNAGDELSKNSVVKTVRENPLPFILIGAGAGLIAYKSLSKKNSSNGGTERRFTNGETNSGTGLSFNSVEQKANGVKDKVVGAASTAYDGIANAASSTAEGARNIASQAYDKAGQLGTATKGKYEQYIEEKPLVIGALALAAGAAVGLSIPISRYEGELMGDARQNLFDKAEETASGFVDKAKEVAAEAGHTITDEISKKTS